MNTVNWNWEETIIHHENQEVKYFAIRKGEFIIYKEIRQYDNTQQDLEYAFELFKQSWHANYTGYSSRLDALQRLMGETVRVEEINDCTKFAFAHTIFLCDSNYNILKSPYTYCCFRTDAQLDRANCRGLLSYDNTLYSKAIENKKVKDAFNLLYSKGYLQIVA